MTRNEPPTTPPCYRWTALASLLACTACTTDDAPSSNDGASSGPRYVIATAVSSDSGATTYVAVLDSLDMDELDLDHAREFGGWSDMGVIGDWVFVSSGEGPEIERFTVNGDRQLEEAGQISFLSYTADANFYNQTLVSPTKAYLTTDSGFVVWNPTTLEITGTLPYPDVFAAREGIEPYMVLDRGAVVRGDRLYVTLAWTDTEELHMLPDSRIVVIDTKTDQVVDVLDAPCPDVMVADRNEAGDLYFSNWVYSPGATILFDESPTCAVRMKAGSEELDDWSFDFANETGHEGAVLAYIGDEHWLYSSFLGEKSAYDPESDDWFDWLFGDTWQLTAFTPKTGTSSDVTGIGRNGGGYYSSRFDGITHLLIPENSYTATSIYALDADGAATRKLHTNGWATRLFKLK